MEDFENKKSPWVGTLDYLNISYQTEQAISPVRTAPPIVKGGDFFMPSLQELRRLRQKSATERNNVGVRFRSER